MGTPQAEATGAAGFVRSATGDDGVGKKCLVTRTVLEGVWGHLGRD